MEYTKKDIVLLVVTMIAVACLGLAACSSIETAPLDPGPPPVFLKVKPQLMSVASEYRIAEGLAVAGPIRAHPVSSIPWIMCLRSASTPRKTYAAFFKGDQYIRSCMSVIEDRCDGESYRQTRDGVQAIMAPSAAASKVVMLMSRLLFPR